jgi:putative FmdB family regulatory protein
MPIYEFQCETCDHCFEKLVFKGDEKNVVCPECGGTQVKKMMSSSCFIGSGLDAGSTCGAGSGGGFS